jgi:DNA polymerase IV
VYETVSNSFPVDELGKLKSKCRFIIHDECLHKNRKYCYATCNATLFPSRVSEMESLRKIIHVDMDAFYASVEQRDDPTLLGRPIAVGGQPSNRGVVASASYEARRYGVRSAMSSARAKRLCPEIVFVSPNFQKYKDVSRKIRSIFYDVTDLVEPLSLDEAYLDVTQNKLSEPLATRLAIHIRERIRQETNLTASAGVAPNKFLAKIASDIRKPDGLCVIPPAKVSEFVEKLPVEKLWGVGPATAERLHALGIFTTQDVRAFSKINLVEKLGKFGFFLHGLAHGHDPRPVCTDREPKSRGSETTFESDVLDKDILFQTLDELAKDVSKSLIGCHRLGQTITIKVRYSNFQTVTRSQTVQKGMNEASAIADAARSLLRSTEIGVRPVRLIGVSLSKLRDVAGEEPSLQLFLDLD